MPGVLRFMGSQIVGHDWANELNWCMKLVPMLFLLNRRRNRRLANSSTYPKRILNYQVISSHIFCFTFVLLILCLACSKKRVWRRDVIFSVPVANYWLKQHSPCLSIINTYKNITSFKWSLLDYWRKVLITQLCLTLQPMDYSPPGFSLHGSLQARILEWIAIPFSTGSSRIRDQTWVSCTVGRFFTLWAIRESDYWAWINHSKENGAEGDYQAWP